MLIVVHVFPMLIIVVVSIVVVLDSHTTPTCLTTVTTITTSMRMDRVVRMIMSMRIVVTKVVVHAPLTPATLIVVTPLLYVVLIVGLLSVKALATILRPEVGLIMHLIDILELIEWHVSHSIISSLPVIVLTTIVLLLLLSLPLIPIDE